MLADACARQLAYLEMELPVGVISALIGGPLFILLLIHHTREAKHG